MMASLSKPFWSESDTTLGSNSFTKYETRVRIKLFKTKILFEHKSNTEARYVK